MNPLSGKAELIALALLILLSASNSIAQVNAGDSSGIDSISSSDSSHTNLLPPEALQAIQVLDFKNTEIKDIVRGLATKYNLNVFVDDAISQRITLRLANLSVHEALRFIAKEHGLNMTLEGNIYKITLPEIPKPQPKPLAVAYEEGRLTVDVKDEEAEKVIRAIAEKSRKSLVLKQSRGGKITGYLQSVPFEQGLQALLTSNGFAVRKKDEIYFIDRAQVAHNGANSSSNNSAMLSASQAWVTVSDSLITLDVMEADLSWVVRELSTQMAKEVFIYGALTGQVNAQCSSLTFDQVLDYVFKGTNYTYRREGKIYFIGDKNLSGIASTQLVRLKHIKAEGILDLLPPAMTSKATLKVIKEQNGLMVVGAQDVIREVEDFVAQIDHPIAQILIEAIVVDYNTSDIGELGITAGMKNKNDTTGHVNLFFPTVDITASGNVLNKSLQYYGSQLGLKKIGKLPDEFLLHLRALERNGKANIRSQPQIATLNGHPASIKIGTTQYFVLKSQNPVVGGNQVINQVTERFEKITAEISLTITPWVSASGEITTEIHPEFSTPEGILNPNVPPTINHRVLDSTVRLRDGETIILGGLIQSIDSENIDKFPLLGSLPLLGRLFQNRSHNRSKAELIIYLTPHLYYSEGSGGVIR
ncbi:secretin and TonB N-terminal domain-containing protein [bacterium]|nr:secretin and TonB N-terminal domain-containing protein [bacterium]MCI0693269.1 secretin and TonB N-terminal domain-containing protein [candidate division KSB1 bacterium]